MSPLRVINPRRPFSVTTLVRKRDALGQTALPGGVTAAPANGPAKTAATKPVRLRQPATRRIMAVAHTERGLLSLNAQQAVAAAALLADTACAVILVPFGPLSEDTAPYGADQVIRSEERRGGKDGVSQVKYRR